MQYHANRSRTELTLPEKASAASVTRCPVFERLEPLRNVDAGVLNIAYYEAGPADGPVVMLLHGFPYDIHSYVDVAPLLAAQGCRVIVPYLRGYGPTRFRDKATPRSGEQAAIGADLMALMDALGLSARYLPATTGAAAPPASARRCGRSAASGWCR